MIQERHKSKELLYNPRNWVFFSIFLTPLLPAVLYKHNCKLLGHPRKGTTAIIGSILYIVMGAMLVALFYDYSSLIAMAWVIISVPITGRIARTQLEAYDRMKEEKNIQGGRNEFPLMMLFLVGLVLLAWLFSSGSQLLLDYLDQPRQAVQQESSNRYLSIAEEYSEYKDQQEDATSEPEDSTSSAVAYGTTGQISLTLPQGYVMSATSDNGYYKIGQAVNNQIINRWGVDVMTIEELEEMHAKCPPGDCMGGPTITIDEYIGDAEGFLSDPVTEFTVLGGQRYRIEDAVAVGDRAFFRTYLTYVDGVRVQFSVNDLNEEDLPQYDDFLEQIHIIGVR